MKKSIIFFILFINIIISQFCLSQWEENVRLTNNSNMSFTSYTNGRSISAFGDTVHIVWDDGDIYYRNSTNGGETWESIIRFTQNIPSPTASSIYSAGEFVHVIWYDKRSGNAEIYYVRSTNNGLSWSQEIKISNSISNSYNPSIFADSTGAVYIAWYDDTTGGTEVYVKYSTDNGISWSTGTLLSKNSGIMPNPVVSASGKDVFIAWGQNSNQNTEIYYRHSTNGGYTWQRNVRLTNDIIANAPSCISVVDSTVHILWNDASNNSNQEIYYKRSTNSGTDWSEKIRLTTAFRDSESPNLFADMGKLHLVWVDSRFGNPEIFYKYSADGGLNWSLDTRLTFAAGTSDRPFVCTGGSKVHVLWHDYRVGNAEIYYARELTGNLVGINNLVSNMPSTNFLSQNYPNPFNPTTQFEFSIPKNEFVNITVYDAMGRQVEVLQNGSLKSGTYKADWNASKYPSGIYFYRITTEAYTETKKMMLIK